MFQIKPKYGLFSSTRKFYDKIDENESMCQDLLKYLNLDKFGNDNKNFAAVLINGHNDNRICVKFERRISSSLQSDNFSKCIIPYDIESFIKTSLFKFEEEILKKMTKLSKKREKMYRRIFNSNNQDPKQLKDLDDIQIQLNSGATVALVIVIKENIYISNIGDNQIILVSKDDDCNDEYNKKFVLLTDEQSFQNEKEIQRIKENCGLDPDALRWLLTLSTERCHSRCIGDFEIKCNFNKFQNLRDAKSSPLISDPQAMKCIPLEDSFTHVILISSGLYYLVRELIYDKDKVPGEITRNIFEIKGLNPDVSLDELCELVVKSFVNEHKKCYDQYKNLTSEDCGFWEYSHHDDLSIFIIELNISQNPAHVVVEAVNGFSLIDSDVTNASSLYDSLDGRDSMNMKDQFSSLKTSSNACLSPVTAYVDFSDWTRALNQLTEIELAFIDSIIDAPESCEGTISEESENMQVSRSTTFVESSTVVTPAPDKVHLFKSLED